MAIKWSKLIVWDFGRIFARSSMHTNLCLSKGRAMNPFYDIHKKQSDPKRQDPEYFEKAAEALPLDDFYIDALGNLYEEKISSERDINMRGDDKMIGKDSSEWLPAIDLNDPRLAYRQVDALRNAPDSVKKIFSVKYGTRRDRTDAWRSALIEKVKHHDLDKSSIETKIALLTSSIRQWCLLLDEINNKPRKPGWLTKQINLAIQMRRKFLRILQEMDSAAFEKILKELKIAYNVPKLPEQMIERRRKAWAEAMLDIRLHKSKESKLAELHQRYIKERRTNEEEMDERVQKVKAEIESIENRLKAIKLLETGVEDNLPKYQPNLIDCVSERAMHAALFYHPKPLVKN